MFTNGAMSSAYGSTSPVDLYNTPVDVELVYSGTTLTATLTQGANTFTKTYTGVDLPGTLGAMAFVGFTGGTGGAVALQQVSNFSYVSTAVPATAYGNAVAVSPGAAGEVDLLVTPVSTGYSMGALAMGSGSTLGLGPVSGSVAHLDYGLTLGAATLAGDATFDVANNGSGLGTLTLGAVGQTAPAGLTKTGAGKLLLTANNTYTGNTTVSGGTLALAGGSPNSVAGSPQIDVAHGATLDVTGLAGGTLALSAGPPAQVLSGRGTVLGTVGGAGLVSPGNSAGVLTAGSVDASGGLDFAFEFAGQDPVYNPAGPAFDSGNDVLRLTSGTPFVGSPAALDGDNTVDVYLDVPLGDLAVGGVFRGGFYTDRSEDFLSSIAGADFNYYVLGDGAGPVLFNGQHYYPLESALGVSGFQVSTAFAPAVFGDGAAAGYVMQLTAVPEPASLVLLAAGLLAIGAISRRRRSRG